MADAGEHKKRTFRKYTYRGVDLDQLLDLSTDELIELFPARQRRRLVLLLCGYQWVPVGISADGNYREPCQLFSRAY
mgnify:CR=1 FL=1